jgi:alcohol dehydrogenase
MAVAGLGGAGVSDAARAEMSTAALCSGICLAQTGLGAVHGVASPLGALFPIPHGVACGATLAAATRVNVAALEQRESEGVALGRYAELGRLLAGRGAATLADAEARTALVQLLEDWRARLAVPRLSAFGITAADIPAIVADSRGSSMKTNPILLTDDEIATILRESL